MNRASTKLRDRRFLALAAIPCITLAEIGRRLNVTREWARQLNLKHGGIVGKQRITVCLIERAATAFQLTRAWRFSLQCEARGIPWEPVVLYNGALSGRTVLVNGHQVRMRNAHRGVRPQYLQLDGHLVEGVDFIAYGIPDTDDWLIVPAERVIRNTMISLNPDLRRGGKRYHHDWVGFVNNFDQLRGSA